MKSEELLKEHNLRVTSIRKEIVEYLIHQKTAVSHAELEAVLSDQFDRVTIYRTLNSFDERGIVHKVIDNNGVTRFALCSHNNCKHEHKDNHVHFRCSVCDKLECLYEQHIPEIALPKSYSKQKSYLLIEGVCANCQN